MLLLPVVKAKDLDREKKWIHINKQIRVERQKKDKQIIKNI